MWTQGKAPGSLVIDLSPVFRDIDGCRIRLYRSSGRGRMIRIVTPHDRTKPPPRKKKRKSTAIVTKHVRLTRAERRRSEPAPLLDAMMWEAHDDAMRGATGEPQHRGRRERHMPQGSRKKIQIYSAGCRLCREAETMIRRIVGFNHDIEVLAMRRVHVASQAARLGIRSVPSVVVDGRLLACRADGAVDEAALRAAIAYDVPNLTPEERGPISPTR
jgi:hypothetical protein